MTIYPEYMDTVTFSDIKKGRIPFYILNHVIIPNTPLHHHDFAEFSYVMAGNGIETINGVSHVMEPGTTRFLLPHQIHKIKSNPESPIRLFCCMFDLTVLFDSSIDRQLYQALSQAGERMPSYSRLPENDWPQMQLLLEGIMEEFRANLIGKDSAIRAKLIEALLLYLRSIDAPEPKTESMTTKDAKEKEWEIIRFLNTNYIKSLSLKDLSNRFGVSASYISRLFKNNLNTSYLEYLHTLRLKRAASLLIISEMPVYEIAEEAGFTSFRTFSRLFKQMYGIKPSEYRLTNRKRTDLTD